MAAAGYKYKNILSIYLPSHYIINDAFILKIEPNLILAASTVRIRLNQVKAKVKLLHRLPIYIK